MYRVDIYIAKKDGNDKRTKNVAKNLSWEAADQLCIQKNKDLGVDTPVGALPGQRYAAFDDQ